MSDKEFLRFIHNIDYYLSFDLCPCKNDSHTQYNATIGDLHCFFGDYSSWNEVVEKWEKRKKRIHKDNLFIIMSDRPSGGIETEITHEDMLSLERVKCAGKMIFTTKKYSDIDYIIHLPKDEEGDYVNSYMYDKIPFLGLWRWELRFDYVKWLNKGM